MKKQNAIKIKEKSLNPQPIPQTSYMSLTHNEVGQYKFNGILDDRSSDMSPSQGTYLIGNAKFDSSPTERKKKQRQAKLPNQSFMDVRKLDLQRSKTKMSKMDVSNYQVDLSDYNYLT